MHRSTRMPFVALLVGSLLALAGTANAALLGFGGELALEIATLAPMTLPGSGVAVVNGSGAAGHLTGLALPASPFHATHFVMPVSDPSAAPIQGVQLTAHNATGSFGGTGGAGFGGPMPLLGVAKICLFGPCASSLANLSIPLSPVGGGGAAWVAGAVNLTVFGAPWTTGTASIGALTRMGGVSPASNTAAPSGALTLVTPIAISTNIGVDGPIPAFGILTLHFVPEPGTLALLGGGIAALLASVRRKPASSHNRDA